MVDYRFSPQQTLRSKRGVFGRFQNAIEGKLASDRWLLRALFFGGLAGLIMIAILVSQSYSSVVAVSGGTLREGILGVPRFVNPVLATTRADLDLVALTHSGLMRIESDGTLVPDLAESVTVSDDGLTYNVLMRRDRRFHDGTPVTARDVAFTIGLAQNDTLKSPLQANWTGVTLQEINEYEINFLLDQAYAPFIENFTLGILPRHIWNEIPVEQIPFSRFNTEPIGSGPFQIEKIERSEAGIVTEYQLRAFPESGLESRLESIVTRFYGDEATLASAFTEGDINATAYLSNEYVKTLPTDSIAITPYPLPRLFGIFLNQNRSAALRDQSARAALAAAVDRTLIIDEALSGFGIPTDSPVPARDTLESNRVLGPQASTTESILLDGGWSRNNSGNWEKRIEGELQTLAVTLRTANTPVFTSTAELVARMWRDAGIVVEIEPFEQTDLLQTVIRPRDYEALLFGLDMSRTVDLYPFWHSSERQDPGLNIAQYANLEVDDLLVSARGEVNAEERRANEDAAIQIIKSESPAVFLFAPIMTYVTTEPLTVVPIADISKPHERFMNIQTWHAESDSLWSIFQ